MIRFACLCALLLPLYASAAPAHDQADAERLEVARDHFQRAESLAHDGKLADALVEYELAEAAHPSPSFTAAKERARARLAAQYAPPPVVLAPPPPPPPPPRTPLGRFVAPIVLAPLAIGALVAGGAVIGVEKRDAQHLRDTCAPGCSPSDVSTLRTRQTVGYALIGVGGGLAAIDAVLWGVLAGTHERPPTQAAIEPSLFGVRGRF